MTSEVLPRTFFDRDAVEVGRDLIGRVLVREVDGRRLSGRIVEVEAYRHDDPASHAYRGLTARNASMFGPPGHAYVYISYGIHHCMNVVTRRSAVLLRALEPLEGIEEMAARRRMDSPRLLCAGPGRLCQALGLSLADDGRDLTTGEGLWLERGTAASRVATTPRVGITVAVDVPWRFVEEGSRFASRARPQDATRIRTGDPRGTDVPPSGS